MFQLSRHRTAKGQPINFTDAKKKGIMKVKGGDDMLDLFKHTRKVNDKDTYDQMLKKIKLALQKLSNRTVAVCKLATQMPQVDQSFDVWYRKLMSKAKL